MLVGAVREYHLLSLIRMCLNCWFVHTDDQAVRLGYMLGLDQKTLIDTSVQPPAQLSDPVDQAQALLDRERLAWTCMCFDCSYALYIHIDIVLS